MLRWVKAYRQEVFNVLVNTNIGVERQKKALKYVYLDMKKTKSLKCYPGGGLKNPIGKNLCFANALLQCIRIADIHRILQYHTACTEIATMNDKNQVAMSIDSEAIDTETESINTDPDMFSSQTTVSSNWSKDERSQKDIFNWAMEMMSLGQYSPLKSQAPLNLEDLQYSTKISLHWWSLVWFQNLPSCSLFKVSRSRAEHFN
ncbi:unnamed protein product [Mytilus edulis]|uniref:Uncharacterized protein n=1 Tax=Mytilus edulis TaxID=6550 RepID=A0A8S3VDV2_MYTED|nr:unnamed protein product [Mytilus edulis]